MPRNPESRGTCAFCAAELTKRSVPKHLQTCPPYQQALQKSSQAPEKLWHIRVQDAYDKDFWLELEMRGSASLTQLDKYLRAIWLECCGHLSEFTLGGWQGRKLAKARKADEIFAPEMVIRHIYDFGTSSETDIKILEVGPGKPLTKHPISLLARNLPPQYTCQECDQKADCMCMECLVETGHTVYLCEKHAEDHEHEDRLVSLVNSPRLGLCGYSGPADPPY